MLTYTKCRKENNLSKLKSFTIKIYMTLPTNIWEHCAFSTIIRKQHLTIYIVRRLHSCYAIIVLNYTIIKRWWYIKLILLKQVLFPMLFLCNWSMHVNVFCSFMTERHSIKRSFPLIWRDELWWKIQELTKANFSNRVFRRKWNNMKRMHFLIIKGIENKYLSFLAILHFLFLLKLLKHKMSV